MIVRKKRRRIITSDESSNDSDQEPLQKRLTKLKQPESEGKRTETLLFVYTHFLCSGTM